MARSRPLSCSDSAFESEKPVTVAHAAITRLKRRTMRILFTTISLAAVLAASPSFAQQVSNTSSTEAGKPRVVRVEATINAPVSEVWRVWTTSKGAEEFFA
jgi:uncharacterized membrane protein